MKKNIIFIMICFFAWTAVGGERRHVNEYCISEEKLQKNIQNYKYYSILFATGCISSAGLGIYLQVACPENAVNTLGSHSNYIIPMILGGAAMYLNHKVCIDEDLLEYAQQLSEPRVFQASHESTDYKVIDTENLLEYLERKHGTKDINLNLYTDECELFNNAQGEIA